MMGQHVRTEPMFYYFRLEDQIPEHHLLRRIDRYVDFRVSGGRLWDAYSSGNPNSRAASALRSRTSWRKVS